MRRAVKAPYQNRAWLHQKYVIEQKSSLSIAQDVGKTTPATICYWLKKLGIPIRSAQEATRLSGARIKVGDATKGRKYPPEVLARMSKAQQNRSLETRARIAAAKLGHATSAATRAKISAAVSGEKNVRWMGGLSMQPYGPGFDRELKKAIRHRDCYVCAICGAGERTRPHCVHHVDYNKRNHSPSNLITLCHRCHSKTNRKRGEWEIYFRQLFKRDDGREGKK
jgi:hypothetical protein